MTVANLTREELLVRAYKNHDRFLEVMYPYFRFEEKPERARIQLDRLFFVIGEVKIEEDESLLIKIDEEMSHREGAEKQLEEFDHTVAHESAHYLDLLWADYDDSRLVKIAEYKLPVYVSKEGWPSQEQHVKNERKRITALRASFGEITTEFATLVFFEKERGEEFANRMSLEGISESNEGYFVKKAWQNFQSLEEKEAFLRVLAR